VQSRLGVGGHGLECLAASGQSHHRVGVEGLDHGAGLAGGADDDVAGQHGRDGRFGLDGLVGQLGPAGAEDDLRVHVDVELGLEGGLEVDLGEDAEPLFGEGGTDGSTVSG
jgi:hypothetical protein